MAIHRITQNMIVNNSFTSMQNAAKRVSRVQEQLSTGRVINRPSDNPADASAAMRMRAEKTRQDQYARNITNGLGWLDRADSTLQNVQNQLLRVRELALRGANDGSMSPAGREGLVAELNQIRDGLIATANTTFEGRPIFGGLATGKTAYTPAGAQVRTDADGDIMRQIADGVSLPVNLNGPEVFGPDGANTFDVIAALAAAIIAGDQAGISAGIDNVTAASQRVVSGLAEIGSRTNRIEAARVSAEAMSDDLASRLSTTENVDVARAAIDLQLAEVAYQASLGAVARAVQPSLIDFLR